MSVHTITYDKFSMPYIPTRFSIMSTVKDPKNKSYWPHINVRNTEIETISLLFCDEENSIVRNEGISDVNDHIHVLSKY